MSLTRSLVGWVAVTVVFLAWREIDRRLPRAEPEATATLLQALPPLLLQGLLLVLIAGLWFGSLGSGGGFLLFLVLGALIELPARLRQRVAGFAWLPALSGILRIALSGVLLGFILVQP